ncbi:substrate-binding periplasmic protein [Sinorhizobium meliloti]|uniref:substrate-binding periplasmic protein n=1 Tax=Rhizobium meliloti TaxID=382 RepID=UPI000B49F779|nr:transporter substrate-binding domain-containing protein [Sinorhizobium meliloti]ASP69717.1 hypothetical protein CDO29_35915 [Sinorhizobium meliloti]MQX01483.1 transporter substrate-binding domain-containing protein [Sinorhizobium meliloti]RVK39178.1 hypothetical protein CN160_35000 [Sinorhizobium meliloti]
MKILTLITIIGITGVVSLTAQSAMAKDTLKVGMDPLYAPFSFQTPDGQLTGFDYEIANAICDAIDVTCIVKAIPADGALPALETGQIDVLINTYGMTKQRLKNFTMVGPYMRSSGRLIVNANSSVDGTEATLKGKTVGVEKGGLAFLRYAQDTFGKYATVTEYEQINDAVLDLNAGRVDAVLGDEIQLLYGFVKSQPDKFKMAGHSITDPKYFGDGNGFMLRKGNTTWPDKLKAALDLIIKEGEYDRISIKYFGRNILNVSR